MKIIWTLLAAAILFPTACSAFLESGSWRYRMTVEVETPEGIKIGSAVREIYVRENPRVSTETVAHVEVDGEAVVVDLGERGVLFAVMRGAFGVDYAHSIVYKVFPSSPGVPPHKPEGLHYYSQLKAGPKEMKPEQWPMMVSFAKRADPTSVEAVYVPTMNWKKSKVSNYAFDIEDNTERVFGEGVQIKRVMLEMTDDPVTGGVIKYLPWLLEYRNQRLDGNRYGTIKSKLRFANSLSAGAFTAHALKGKKDARRCFQGIALDGCL